MRAAGSLLRFRLRSASRFGALVVVMSILAVAAVGCSLLVDTSDRSQCRTNADCDANPLWRGRVCDVGFCVIKGANPDLVSTNDGGAGCVSTELCTQANSGRASVCKKAGTPCIPWQIDDVCPSITGDWSNPDAIVIGAILPLGSQAAAGLVPAKEYSTRVSRAMTLAVEELEDKVPGGLVQVGAKARPIALLQCNSAAEGNTARERLTFLTDVVGAQAVIVGWTEDYAAVATLAVQKKTAVVCSDCLIPFPQDLAPWKIVPPITLDAPLVAWRVSDLETKIKESEPATSSIRVALLTEPLRAPRAFSEELLTTLKFNGKSAGDNGANGFLPIELEPIPQRLQHAMEIAAFAPRIIVVGMGPDFPMQMLTLIEQSWPVDKPRPFYIVTQLNYEVTPWSGMLPTDELRLRISGTHPRISQELHANVTGFETRYRQRFAQEADGNFSGYEAVYAAAYAMVAASTEANPAIDGPSISAGFARLVSGPAIDFAPNQIYSGLTFLRAPGSIDVRGLTSELDWNLQTREVRNDMSMFCIGRDANNALFLKPDAGDAVYSAKTGTVTGTYACD